MECFSHSADNSVVVIENKPYSLLAVPATTPAWNSEIAPKVKSSLSYS